MNSGNVKTITEWLLKEALKNPSRIVFWREQKENWCPITASLFVNHICSLAESLFDRKLISSGEIIGIQMETCYEWEVVDKAVLLCGGQTLGISFAISGQQIKEQLNGTNVKYIVRKNAFDDGVKFEPIDCDNDDGCFEYCLEFDKNEMLYDLKDIETRYQNASENIAIILHTSGTTGAKKELRFTHNQVIDAVLVILDHYRDVFKKAKQTICWLPMENLTSRILNLVSIFSQTETYFVSNPKNIVKTLSKVSPDFFLAVPYFYEKVWREFSLKLRRRCLFFNIDFFLMRPLIRWLFKKIIFGGHSPFLFSGSAPMSPRVLKIYEDLNLPVLELYGMSECVIPIALGLFDDYRAGSVGPVVNQVNFKIEKDGGLCIRSSGVENSLIVDDSGWFKTSDIVAVDDDGFLKVLGRSDDVIKTATGKRISLYEIEEEYKGNPFFEQVVVVGKNLPFVVGLIVLTDDFLKSYHDHFSVNKIGKVEIIDDSRIVNTVTRWISMRNSQRPVDKRLEKFVILKNKFSVKTGELTANLKVRRKIIEEKYLFVIEKYYGIKI